MVDLSAAYALARPAIESTYEGLMSVSQQVLAKEQGSNISKPSEQPIAELQNKACRLSFDTNNPTAQGDVNAEIVFVGTIFTAPELDVPEGVKITVVQHGKTYVLERAGQGHSSPTHQEIPCGVFRDYA